MRLQKHPTQVGGHSHGQTSIMKTEDGKLLKLLQLPPRGQREANFYMEINRSSHDMDKLIKSITPKFYGLEHVSFNEDQVTKDYLVLEDLTGGFQLPSVMDVKIGKQTWGPDASEEKIRKEMNKCKGTKSTFGFSIIGLNVHSLDPTDPVQVRKFDKSFGNNLKTQDVGQVPQAFFGSNTPPMTLVKIMVDKISAVKEVFEMQRRYKFYASSLLLAYDTDSVRKFIQGINDEEELKKSVRICLIDFAHVYDANDDELDENVLNGLGNLLDLFKDYMKRYEEVKI